jgi:putative FmdB family regulatory protein
MPIYVYQATDESAGCDHCGPKFEVIQAMSEPSLTICPTCGNAVERIISATAIHGSTSSQATLSNKNLAEKGFTKYQKAGDGTYERVAGDKGPKVIHK